MAAEKNLRDRFFAQAGPTGLRGSSDLEWREHVVEGGPWCSSSDVLVGDIDPVRYSLSKLIVQASRCHLRGHGARAEGQ